MHLLLFEKACVGARCGRQVYKCLQVTPRYKYRQKGDELEMCLNNTGYLQFICVDAFVQVCVCVCVRVHMRVHVCAFLLHYINPAIK